MRRLTAAVATACLAMPMAGAGLGLAAGPAAAQDATEPPATEPPEDGDQAPEPVPGEEQCTIGDERLIELSGLVAFDDGYIVVNDSTEFVDRQPIFILGKGCRVVDEIAYPSLPRDPEALELDREANVLWVADIGDNAAGGGEGEVRASVALWRVELDGDRIPEIYRFTFPDGEARDGEALVLDGDGTPIIITKDGTAELFAPEELRPSSGPDDTVALEPLGEFGPPETDTDNPFGAAGRQVITGGANSPDGSAVVLRSYADAFEFEVTDGEVAAAITDGEPLVTPLPDEPQGEAISYSADGEQFLTVSEAPEGDTGFTPALLSYAPAEPAPPPEEAAEEPTAESGGGGLFNDLQDIINLIAAIGVIGLLLVAAGVFGILRARRRGSRPGAGGGGPGGEDGPDGPGDAPVTGRARLTGFPGESQPGWEQEQAANQTGVYTSGAVPPAGGEYGSGPDYDGAEYRGREYGGGEYHGTEYGGGGEYRGGAEYGSAEYSGGEYAGGQGYGGQGYGGQEYGGQGYGGHEYGGQEYGQQPYGGAEPGYPGNTYGRGGYPNQPYDQEWSNGYHDDRATGHGYVDGGYAGGNYAGGAYPPHPEAAPQAGTYSGGAYQSSGAPHPADGRYAATPEYSDDPDYPYEFRERGRW